MKKLALIGAVLFSLGASCARTPGPTTTQGIATQPQGGARYLYVSDAKAVDGSGSNELLVYQLGDQSSGPIRSVQFSAEPTGVAVDAAGDVYIAVASTVLEYSPGATDLIATIDNGVHGATGLAFDAAGNLYVANRGIATKKVPSPQPYISEYAPGVQHALTTKVTVPGQFLVDGIAVDRAGNIYASIQQSQGGFLVQVLPGGQTEKIIDGMAGMGGVAIDPQGQLVAGAVGYVATYAGSPWRKVRRQVFPLQSVRLLTIASDGTVVIPLRQTLPAPSVVIERPTSSGLPYRITTGLHAPNGAAISPAH
jgi:sugar lactone lactonase YvrE